MTTRLSALSIIWVLLSTLIVKMLGAVPGALKLSIHERDKTAEGIIAELRNSGIAITPADARKIVDEVATNPKELKESLEELRKAFESFKAK